MESHGQRRRCRRGMMRGHGGPWGHGMRGGGCGPWGMRGGRFGCHPRGRGGWCGVPTAVWYHEQPAAAATATATATAQQPPAGAPQTTDSSAAPAAAVPDTNAETGEMAVNQYEATAAATDQDWTLVNDGVIDVDAATTGVEQLHVSPAADAVAGTCSNAYVISSFFCKSSVPCFTQSRLQ